MLLLFVLWKYRYNSKLNIVQLKGLSKYPNCWSYLSLSLKVRKTLSSNYNQFLDSCLTQTSFLILNWGWNSYPSNWNNLIIKNQRSKFLDQESNQYYFHLFFSVVTCQIVYFEFPMKMKKNSSSEFQNDCKGKRFQKRKIFCLLPLSKVWLTVASWSPTLTDIWLSVCTK